MSGVTAPFIATATSEAIIRPTCLDRLALIEAAVRAAGLVPVLAITAAKLAAASPGMAILAALTTGILEATQLSAADRKSSLQGVVIESVKALVNPLFNGPVANFAQSNGTVGGSSLTFPKGVAGGITGFVAQMVNPADTTISADVTNALFQASYNAGLLTGTAYTLDIAQAAGQAYGWVSGITAINNPAAAAAVSSAIANAVRNGYPVLALANIQNAVDFGISQANGGVGAAVPGVGAGGLRDIIFNPAAPFYDHHSAQGRPVSNIFSL